MVEYEYAMYAPYHPDLTDVASFEVSQTQAEDCRRSSASDLESVPCRLIVSHPAPTQGSATWHLPRSRFCSGGLP